MLLSLCPYPSLSVRQYARHPFVIIESRCLQGFKPERHVHRIAVLDNDVHVYPELSNFQGICSSWRMMEGGRLRCDFASGSDGDLYAFPGKRRDLLWFHVQQHPLPFSNAIHWLYSFVPWLPRFSCYLKLICFLAMSGAFTSYPSAIQP